MKTIIKGTGFVNAEGQYVVSEEDKQKSLLEVETMRGEIKAIVEKYYIVHEPIDYLDLDGYRGNPRYDENFQMANYSLSFELPDWGKSPNFRRLPDHLAHLHARTGFWANGYNEMEFKRSYAIQVFMGGMYRPKFHKKWHKTDIVHKYILADNMPECICEFARYMSSELQYFLNIRVKQNL